MNRFAKYESFQDFFGQQLLNTFSQGFHSRSPVPDIIAVLDTEEMFVL